MEKEPDDHSRTIIHIDLDCFYAQVEMIKTPKLRGIPFGIQQKNIVVTSNYEARKYEIKKCMLVSEARKLCPSLILVNGEDLHDYRQASYKVTALLQKYSNLVERLGLDENFIDVTKLVSEKLVQNSECIGNVFGDVNNVICDCGCYNRLKIGTVIAQEIRNTIKKELTLTSSAGIAHNKLLAKIVGSKHKPDQQTVIFPNSALELMLSLNSVNDIPGIGKSTSEMLHNVQIKSVKDLQTVDLGKLKILGVDKLKLICDLSFGVDKSLVKSSGRPHSIGLEDSCKSISIEIEVKEKLLQLLNRLLILIKEDGRVPRTIKLTVRKFDKANKISYRETKQCNVTPSVFNNKNDKENRLVEIIMNLFNKLVNVNNPYHITLLGLAFTKFQDPPNVKNSIVSFLKKNYEVQSVTSIENTVTKKDQQTQNISHNQSIPSTSGLNKLFEDSSPRPKKIRFNDFLNKQHFANYDECASPSKLKVADLNLNSDVYCPPNTDKEVFYALPRDIQKELWEDYKRERNKEQSFCSSQVKKSKPNTLFNYFVKNN